MATRPQFFQTPPWNAQLAKAAQESPAIQGKRIVMNTIPSGANLLLQPTQLISARINQPRQWVVTLAQVTPQDPNISPWPAPGDGTTTTAGLKAARFPLQVAMRWGAGGAAFETRFDLPAQGTAFGVTADTMDLNVVLNDNPASWAVPANQPGQLPVIGAFMVPGTAADPTPLRWTENIATGPVALVTNLRWSIKPYARKVQIAIQGATGNTVSVTLGNQVWTFVNQNVNMLLDVGALDTFITFSKLAGVPDPTVDLIWHIGLT